MCILCKAHAYRNRIISVFSWLSLGFAVGLICVRGKDGDIPVQIQLTITDFNETAATHNVRTLEFKFMKICRKGCITFLS